MTNTSLSALPSAVVLSRGSTFNPQPHEPPYTLPQAGSVWPDGATAQIVFYDNAGAQLAAIDALSVDPGGITFTPTGPDVMDQVPNGANFELFLTTSDSLPYQIRHGKVVRKEANFLQAPPISTIAELQFADSWPVVGLRSTWVKMAGAPNVRDNTGITEPNSLGLSDASAATTGSLRWYQQLNGNNFRIVIKLVRFFSNINGTSSRLRVFGAVDQYLTTGVGFELTDILSGGGTRAQSVSPLLVTGKTTVAYQGSPTAHTINNADIYTVDYNDESKTVSLYAGTTEGTAIADWVDSGAIAPHGPGYRFLGLGWSNSANDIGLQISNWQAADYV